MRKPFLLTNNVHCLALTDTNWDRTTLGVGEYMDLSGMRGETTWTNTAGSLSTTNGAATTLSSPSNAISGTITATVRKESVEVNFSTKEPTGYDPLHTVTNSGDCWYPPPPVVGAGMYIHVVIAPTDVSFSQVIITEVGEPASDFTGWYLTHTNVAPNHSNYGANKQITLGCDNSWTDHAYGTIDYIAPGWTLGSADGGFTWQVPVVWQVRNGPTNGMAGWSQIFNFYSDGSVKVSKFGHNATRARTDTCSTLH